MGPGSLRRNGESSKESRTSEVARASLLELPRSLAGRIRELAPPIPDATLARLVAETSRAYTRERSRLEHAASDEARIARLRFFLPRDLPKAMAVFRDLDLRGRLPRRETLRVLDLGAGLGTTTLSLARYAHLSGAASTLDVTAVDLDGAALATMARLVGNLEGFASIALTPKERDLRRVAASAGGPFDVIAIGLALNELADDVDERAQVLASLVSSLAEDGILVAIEPALRDTTRALMRLRDVIFERSTRTHRRPVRRTEPLPAARERARLVPCGDSRRARPGARDDREGRGASCGRSDVRMARALATRTRAGGGRSSSAPPRERSDRKQGQDRDARVRNIRARAPRRARPGREEARRAAVVPATRSARRARRHDREERLRARRRRR